MKRDKILYYVGLVLLTIGVGLALASLILSRVGISKLADIFGWVSSALGMVAFAILLIRLNLQVKSPLNDVNKPNGPKVVVKVVDVKDLPKTKEQQLYEQYENLYKQKLITKKDLENKKKELLG